MYCYVWIDVYGVLFDVKEHLNVRSDAAVYQNDNIVDVIFKLIDAK